MLYLNYNENKQHGSKDFPVEFYHVDSNHPRYEMPFHWHKEYELVRILDGLFCFTLDDTEIVAHAGDSVFIPSGMIHGGIPDDCLYECLVFDPDILYIHSDRCRLYLKKIKHQDIIIPSLITQDAAPLSHTINCLFDIMSAQTPGYELIAAGRLLEFFGLVYQENAYTVNRTQTPTPFKHSQQLKSVFEFIENNYASNITLQQLSQISGMSSKYFCRYFQTIAHRTPMDYLNYYRIERSCHLLCTCDLPVTDIAYDCGFNDCSYYIKLFKRYKHITPKQYQLQMKQ